jgi:hypothetical protein
MSYIDKILQKHKNLGAFKNKTSLTIVDLNVFENDFREGSHHNIRVNGGIGSINNMHHMNINHVGSNQRKFINLSKNKVLE